MVAVVYVEMNTQSFETQNGSELARILRKQADSVDGKTLTPQSWQRHAIQDSSGKAVGGFELNFGRERETERVVTA